MLFVCPKCREKLNICRSGSAKCPAGHSYDRSRDGYYNLLLSSKGGIHGDNAEMIAARAAFLSAGYYEPLARALSELACEYVQDAAVLLDAGCGEGYYTEYVSQGFDNLLREGKRKEPLDVYGFDISKSAAKRAAKRMRGATVAVASSYNIPMSDGSAELLLNTFSPMATEEVARVLRAGGIFLMAIPAEEHLFELKREIYDTPYKNEPADTNIPGFGLVAKKELRFTLRLDCAEAVRSLFAMTPYAYRTSSEGRARVCALEHLDCTAHFIILVYKKL